MGLRSGWWVLSGVENKVGEWWWVLWWQRWRFCGGFSVVVYGSGFGSVWGVGCGSLILDLCV